MKDRLGVEVKSGDYIAYAGQAGRCAVLHIGRVLDTVKREKDYWHRTDYEKLKVELLEEGFGESWSAKQGKTKIVYLQFPERLIVVNHYVQKPKEAVHGE